MNGLPYILIAEDDEDDRFLINEAFNEEAEGVELLFAENGIELVTHFEKYEQGIVLSLPSLLVIDLNMPRKNGTEAIRELAAKNYFRSFPTIVFSTTANEYEKKQCREFGIEDFFVKPAGYYQLQEMVARFLKMMKKG